MPLFSFLLMLTLGYERVCRDLSAKTHSFPGACFLAASPDAFTPSIARWPRLAVSPAASSPRFPPLAARSIMSPAVSGPGALRTLSMQADGGKRRGSNSGGVDYRRRSGGGGERGGRGGGGRGERGGFRAPPVLSAADLADLKELPGVQTLLSQEHKVIVLAIGKARLFYEGNPVVFGGAVGAVLGEPKPGDVVTVTDHNGKQVGWGVYNPDSMYRVRMLWLDSIDGPAGDTRDVAATLVKRLAAAGMSVRVRVRVCVRVCVFILCAFIGTNLFMDMESVCVCAFVCCVVGACQCVYMYAVASDIQVVDICVQIACNISLY